MILINGSLPSTGDLSSIDADLATIEGKIDTVASYVDTEVAAIVTKLAKPAADAATDATVAEALGIKADTVAGTSAIARLKQILAAVAFPSQNSANNATPADVLGNKTDDESGNSLYSHAYIAERHNHSRTRTYPYLAAGVTLTANNSALTMGTIVEIVPTTANEINTLTITHSCDIAGNITIDLNGEKFTKAITVGDTANVAAQLRAMTFVPVEGGAWTIGGSGSDVTFTRAGLSTTAVLSNLGTTGITGSIVKTQTGAGIQKEFDIHGLQVGLMGNQDTYIVTLYKGASGYEERICSRRITTTANNQAGGEVSVDTPRMPAGTRISASVASVAGGASKTAVVSVSYHLY